MLPKSNRLQPKYFKSIFEQGKKFRGQYGMLIIKKYDSGSDIQLGFVVSKKIGNAVKRHKMTRVLREVTREIMKEYPKNGSQGIYVAFKYCDSYEKLKSEISVHFKDALGNS